MAAFTARFREKLVARLALRLPGGFGDVVAATPLSPRLTKSKLSLNRIRTGRVCCRLVWRAKSESDKAIRVALVVTRFELTGGLNAGPPGTNTGEGVIAGESGVRAGWACEWLNIRTTTAVAIHLMTSLLIFKPAGHGLRREGPLGLPPKPKPETKFALWGIVPLVS